ncbi:MDR family MFS transporter [Caldisalinibacter kiritimatiensis]|uniref:Permease of the major facilitator superfamily n=1 Tax=Caldisalinibacter kiritimatiensis TaxID=1304284 RepID=R1AWK0_9FIRM|nr:MFS transporter [Caldisalinibacter kiritimatiensis]EOD01548.1 permease of the major facilitator superfamily [Caldisalinibacter kiritimatiensis]
MGIKEELKTYVGLPKSIYVLFFARIINSMGAFVFPFLTFFLTENLGMGEEIAGKFVFMSAMSYVPGSIIGGKLSDHIGRKKIIIFFQALAAICFIPCAFLGNSIVVPWLLILAGVFGGAAQPAYSAMMADLTNTDNRKPAFSLLYLGINIGFAVGPLIAGILYNNYIEWIFLGDAATTFISLILIMIYVHESLPTEDEIEQSKELDTNERAEEGNLFEVLLKRPQLLAFALVSTIYSFVYAQHSFALAIQVKDIFGMDKGTVFFGMLGTTNALVVVVMTLFLTSLTKKLKPILNISIAGILNAIGFGIIYYIAEFPMFVFSTIVWTMGEILNVTNSGVYIANHAPMTHRGRFNTILSIITGAGFALSPVIMGSFIENHGVRQVWPLVFVLSMGAAVLMYILYRVEKSQEQKKDCIKL